MKITFVIAVMSSMIVLPSISASAVSSETVSTLSVPALLCLARLTARLTPEGILIGPPDQPLEVTAQFMLAARVEVRDDPEIRVRFPAPHRAGETNVIEGGREITCDREGRILNSREWR